MKGDYYLLSTKLMDALAEFQTVYCKKCFEWYSNHWPHFIKSQEVYFDKDTIA